MNNLSLRDKLRKICKIHICWLDKWCRDNCESLGIPMGFYFSLFRHGFYVGFWEFKAW